MVALTADDWRRKARRRLPRFAFDYLDGGAGDERCLERNRDALDSLALVPDALCDVTDCSTRTVVFGDELAYPLIVAPTGLNGLLWHDGDVALARTASHSGIPSLISSASTSAIGEVTAANPQRVWFQLYAFGDRRITEALLRTASAARCTVLMLTVDAAVRFGTPELVNLDPLTDRATGAASGRAMLLSRSLDRSLTWKTIDCLRERWPGRLVLKGILRPSDAKRSAECGVDAIVVSNHGGRQLDSAPATIDALPAVLEAAGQAMPVLIDGGFRSAGDIVKALALGGSAVLLGRFLLRARGRR